MEPVIIFTARYLIILLPLFLLHLLWTMPPKERVRFATLILFSFGIAFVLAKFGTLLYDNPRPFIVGNFEPLVPHGIENGFPSLHTLFSATVASLIFTRSRLLGITLFCVALLIGIARVLGGVHHGIDVVAGASIAILAVYCARQLLSIRVYR